MPTDYIVPPCHEEIEILHQHEDYWVIVKPSGLLSVPGKLAENYDSVFSRLQQQFGQAFIVHRLDLDTSGLMVVARNKKSLRLLNEQFEKRQTYKEYTAVVWGVVKTQYSEITMPMICDWPHRPKQKVCYETGKPAHTKVEVLSIDQTLKQSRLRLIPVTGRSHQLRVHTAALHHPILGCDFYAHPEAYQAAPRLLLHAHQLCFNCPTSGERLSFSKPAPF